MILRHFPGRYNMDDNRLVKANKNDNSIKIMIAVIVVLVLLIVGLCLYLFVFGKVSPGDDVSATSDGSSSVPESVSQAAPAVSEEPSREEPSSEPEFIPVSEVSEQSAEESSAPEEISTEPDEEPEHQWVINNLGYTYLYQGYGFEQFTFSSNIVNRYTSAVNKLKELTGSKRVYQILVPTNCEFFSIPASVKQEDDFYCASQRKFMNAVFNAVDDSIVNVDVYNAIETHYDEKLYFNTDPNYTHLGAYYVYEEFCKAAGIAPITGMSYSQKVLNEQFLGKFFTSTRSERVMNNADKFVYFDIDELYNASEKVYRGTGIVNRKGVIFADTGSYNYYTFLGEEAKKIEITGSGDSSRSLLLIGDSSAAAFATFLVPNYGRITYINSALHSDNIIDLLSGSDFDDVVLIYYNTTAGRLLYSDLNRLTGNANE